MQGKRLKRKRNIEQTSILHLHDYAEVLVVKTFAEYLKEH